MDRMRTAPLTNLPRLTRACFYALLGMALMAASARAQFDPEKLQIQFGPGSTASKLSDVVTITARFTVTEGSRSGRLYITAEIEPGWHVYSLTQPAGGPIATKIEPEPSDEYRLTAEFRSRTAPHTVVSDIWQGLAVETHEDQVIWYAPIEVAEGSDPTSITIEGRMLGMTCDAERCLPPSEIAFVASFASDEEAKRAGLQAATGDFRQEYSHAIVRGYVEPQSAAPGQKVQLHLTLEPTDGYHVYALADRDPEDVSKPALIVVDGPADWSIGAATADRPPKVKPSDLVEDGEDRYYEQPITWTVEIEVPTDAASGVQTITGVIGYQTCLTSCDRPMAARFEADVTIGDTATAGQIPLAFTPASYSEAAELAVAQTAAPRLDLDNLDIDTGAMASAPLSLMLLTAFAAGFILNFMPCVLPVIGLKLMTFVEQSGQSRAQVLGLNIWFSLGLMSVFMVLATMAVFFGIGWGAQFSDVRFNIVLTSILFVFALSFLGVWEIPIPGLVGSGKAGELAAQEGPSGAFAKGVLTTILATPCSGPLLVPALAWAVAQPAAVAYASFACVGLGMASPYLVIGAFPRLIRFLPKPGAWMETLKHIMGFVLLGTVVFLLTFIEIPYVVPTLAFLIGLWAACWWIGRTPLTESLDKKLSAWIRASAFAALIGFVAFAWLNGVMGSRFQTAVDRELSQRNVALGELASQREHAGNELPWQLYTPELLQKLTAEQKTVLVDFTADW